MNVTSCMANLSKLYMRFNRRATLKTCFLRRNWLLWLIRWRRRYTQKTSVTRHSVFVVCCLPSRKTKIHNCLHRCHICDFFWSVKIFPDHCTSVERQWWFYSPFDLFLLFPRFYETNKMIVVEVFRVIFVTEDKNYCRLRQDNKILFWLRWKKL